MKTDTPLPLAIRFWPKVDMAKGHSSCWLWLGAKHKEGHGQLWYEPLQRAIYTHRAAWILTYGEIPEGKVVRHMCDNNSCVNPLHLCLGSQGDNVYDAITRSGLKLGGLDKSKSALTEEQIDTIRLLMEQGVANREITLLFKIPSGTVSTIRKGKKKTRGILSPAYVTKKSRETIHKNTIELATGVYKFTEE